MKNFDHSAEFKDDLPLPSVDRIDYSNPAQYLNLQKSFGRLEEFANLASVLGNESASQTLLSICHYINRNLEHDNTAGYSYRTAGDIYISKKFGGCAEFAVLFTALARSCGIPTIFVKTMDIDWIKQFVLTGETENWRGHVYLEVFYEDQWRLLEPINAVVYNDYKPTMRILPGDRFSYDKGADPFELILSMDWQRWKIQTSNYFNSFDLARFV